MKSYSSLLLSLIIAVGAASSALAQIELSTGDGNTVKVGPGGIFVQSGNNAVKIPATKAKVGHANLKTTKAKTTVIPGNFATNKNILVSANNLEATYKCNGDSCTIFSNNCTIRLNGNCRALSVTGNNNEVICENIAAISITGNNNSVTWKAGSKKPSLSVLGNNNETGVNTSN